MPCLDIVLTSSITAVVCNKALDGIQPTFRHVPPSVAYFSIIAVLNPNCAQRIAATYPPGPEPIMVTSN